MGNWWRSKRKKGKRQADSSAPQQQGQKDRAAPGAKSGQQNAQQPQQLMQRRMASSLEETKRSVQELFVDCSDLVLRELQVGSNVKGLIVYLDGLVKVEVLESELIRPILSKHESTANVAPDALMQHVVSISQATHADTYGKVAEGILGGSAVLFVDGYESAAVFSVQGGKRRGVEEPATEVAIRGPREGFTESLRTNTMLLRFRVKTPNLKMVTFKVGQRTKTDVVLSYLSDVADPKVIDEVTRRIQSIEIDSVLESGYIEELIEDEPYSPFPQIQYTERPDTVAAQLLEGRFAILVDGTPFVLTGPVTFWQFLQSSEDYYERFIVSTMIRWLRYGLVLFALYLPSLYIAITTFHPDMLPTNLLLSVATSRETIPFPALVEALMMELSFEALREAGIRLPKYVGQSVSILGALVIGQAAVQAGIVSAPVVIIVSMTGIASFTIPRYNAAIAVRMLRFPMMFLGGSFGIFGLVIGTMWLITHLSRLRSFGVPYLSGIAPYKSGEQQDIFVREPLWKMLFRPSSVTSRNRDRQRMKRDLMPKPPTTER